MDTNESPRVEILRRLNEICETQRIHGRQLDQLDEAMRGDETGRPGLFARVAEVERHVADSARAKWIAVSALIASAAAAWFGGGRN